MPAHAPRRAQLGGLRLAGFQPLDQRKRCHLRVGEDRKAADVGDVRRWDVHRSAKLLDPVDGSVHVVDSDISDPVRRRTRSPRVLRHVHQPGDGGISNGKQAIGQTGHRGIPRAPAHDTGVEGLGDFYVCRHQLVPDETAMRIDHVCFSFRACKEVVATAFEATRRRPTFQRSPRKGRSPPTCNPNRPHPEWPVYVDSGRLLC